MKRFIARHSERIVGCLSGFDRLVFRGTLRRIAYRDGFGRFLNATGVLLKDFGAYVSGVTATVKAASAAVARECGRPVVYLPSLATNKEEVALEIARRDGVESGLIAVLQCVEPCLTFTVRGNRARQQLELVSELRKCLHSYHYVIDPTFGLMNARIQTWFPFNIQVCLNGREWLARDLERGGLLYRRWDNSFPWLDDVEKAQRLMDAQLRVDWGAILDGIAARLNPAHPEIFGAGPLGYYWSTYQSEWATDVMFRSPEALAEVFPAFVLHAMTSFNSPDVMRFLGRRVRHDFTGEVVSDFKDRVEGVRVKHRLGANSLKGYDKYSILRIETTINDPTAFRVFRPKEGGPTDQRSWRTMRQGVADLYRRAEVSEAANRRYLDALSAVDTDRPLGELARGVCQTTTWKRHRVRALRPWSPDDLELMKAVSRGEFHLSGFRNRDLLALLETPDSDPKSRRRASARIGRKIRLLRAHGLVRKLGKTHRYVLTSKGNDLIPALLATQRVTLQQLRKAAA